MISAKSPRRFIALLLILVLSAGLYIGIAALRPAYYVDEYLTYTLSNGRVFGQVDFLSPYEDVDAFYTGVLGVTPEEAFHFEKPIENARQDAHPPLYYMLVHGLCSLVSPEFSIHIAEGVNLVFFLVSILLCYLILKEILPPPISAMDSLSDAHHRLQPRRAEHCGLHAHVSDGHDHVPAADLLPDQVVEVPFHRLWRQPEHRQPDRRPDPLLFHFLLLLFLALLPALYAEGKVFLEKCARLFPLALSGRRPHAGRLARRNQPCAVSVGRRRREHLVIQPFRSTALLLL